MIILNEMSETEKAYIAGFLDADGNICLSKYKHKNTKRGFAIYTGIQLTNTNKEIIEWIAEKINYKFKIQEQKRGGRRKNAFVIQIQSRERVLEILKKIKPYLILKKERADLMIQYCEIRRDRASLVDSNNKIPYTDQEVKICEKMGILNQRGTPIILEEEALSTL